MQRRNGFFCIQPLTSSCRFTSNIEFFIQIYPAQLKWAKIAKMFYFFLAIILVYEVGDHLCKVFYICLYRPFSINISVLHQTLLCDWLNILTSRICFRVYLLFCFLFRPSSLFTRSSSSPASRTSFQPLPCLWSWSPGEHLTLCASDDFQTILMNVCYFFQSWELLSVSALGSFLLWNCRWSSWTFSSATPWSSAQTRWKVQSYHRNQGDCKAVRKITDFLFSPAGSWSLWQFARALFWTWLNLHWPRFSFSSPLKTPPKDLSAQSFSSPRVWFFPHFFHLLSRSRLSLPLVKTSQDWSSNRDDGQGVQF